MALPVLAFFPWLIGLFGSSLTALFTFFSTFLAVRYAARFAILTLYVVAVAAATALVAVTVKNSVLQAQVGMPSTLGAATYFLPSSINLILGVHFSMRITFYLYIWLRERLGAYVRVATS